MVDDRQLHMHAWKCDAMELAEALDDADLLLAHDEDASHDDDDDDKQNDDWKRQHRNEHIKHY